MTTSPSEDYAKSLCSKYRFGVDMAKLKSEEESRKRYIDRRREEIGGNPFTPGSVSYWMLEDPVVSQFKEYQAEIAGVEIEDHHTGILIYRMDIKEGAGTYWAIGGTPMIHSEPVIREALDVFGVNTIQELKGLPCLLCLWHGRSVAVRHPVTRRLHFPEQSVKQQSI